MIPAAVCAYTDLKTKMIPNKITFPVIISGLIYAVCTKNLTNALLGFAFAFAIFFMFVQKDVMGAGDLKLAAGMGVWFGFYRVQWVILIASALGIVWGFVQLYRTGKLKEWFASLGPFFGGLYLRFRYGVRGVIPIKKLPDNWDEPVPEGAFVFGPCLAGAAWLVWWFSISNV